jgi:ribosomal protein L7Ae-like RNA K-turn-binding protein
MIGGANRVFMDDFSKEIALKAKVAGLKQTARGIHEGIVSCVLIAKDADAAFKKEITALCKSKNVPYQMERTKEEIGKELGLDVACAAVGFLKDNQNVQETEKIRRKECPQSINS